MEQEPQGKAKGAKVLAEMMTPEERKERAKKAALARWGVRPPKAIRKGSFQKEFGLDVECYVLDDEHKTAVIHQRGMGEVLGFSKQSGGRLTRFIDGKNIAPYLGPDLRGKLENPIIFQDLNTVSGEPSNKRLHGFDVTLIIDVCKAIVAAKADGSLTKNQEKIAKQAHIILNASAKAGITGLVYALTGYDVTREEVITAFKLYVQQEAREYEKEFPAQLYEQWYRLYKLPKPERNHPWKFKHLTVNHVYVPLAKSNGKIHDLVVAERAANGKPWNKLHQFLAEIGVKTLRTHLGQLLGIAQVSKNKNEYELHVNNIFGDQFMFDFNKPISPTLP